MVVNDVVLDADDLGDFIEARGDSDERRLTVVCKSGNDLWQIVVSVGGGDVLLFNFLLLVFADDECELLRPNLNLTSNVFDEC